MTMTKQTKSKNIFPKQIPKQKIQDIAYIYICSLGKVAVVTVATSARMWTFHMRTFHMLRLYVYAPFAKCLSYHIFIHCLAFASV